MRAPVVAAAVAFVLLLSLAGARPALGSLAVGQSYPWMDPGRATEYAIGLLGRYEELAAQNQSGGASDSPLHLAQGETFGVLVVKAYSPAGESLACFLFTPMQGSTPQVSVDEDATMAEMLPGVVYNDNMTILSPRVSVSGAPADVSLVWVTLTSDVMTDTQANSESAATWLFKETGAQASQAWYEQVASLVEAYLPYLVFGAWGCVTAAALIRERWQGRVRRGPPRYA